MRPVARKNLILIFQMTMDMMMSQITNTCILVMFVVKETKTGACWWIIENWSIQIQSKPEVIFWRAYVNLQMKYAGSDINSILIQLHRLWKNLNAVYVGELSKVNQNSWSTGRLTIQTPFPHAEILKIMAIADFKNLLVFSHWWWSYTSQRWPRIYAFHFYF